MSLTTDDGLQWLRADAYHARTQCGRYTVAKVNVGEADVYVAWLARTAERPATELASFRIPICATDERRLVAINAMKARCAEHATIHVEPSEKAA